MILCNRSRWGPIFVKKLGGHVIYTDGHTRALVAYLSGLSEVQEIRDEDDLDWEAYGIYVEWCMQKSIRSIADLEGRVVTPAEYKELWVERCSAMHHDLEVRRKERP